MSELQTYTVIVVLALAYTAAIFVALDRLADRAHRRAMEHRRNRARLRALVLRETGVSLEP